MKQERRSMRMEHRKIRKIKSAPCCERHKDDTRQYRETSIGKSDAESVNSFRIPVRSTREGMRTKCVWGVNVRGCGWVCLDVSVLVSMCEYMSVGVWFWVWVYEVFLSVWVYECVCERMCTYTWSVSAVIVQKNTVLKPHRPEGSSAFPKVHGKISVLGIV